MPAKEFCWILSDYHQVLFYAKEQHYQMHTLKDLNMMWRLDWRAAGLGKETS